MIYSDYSIGKYKKQTYIPKICSKNFLTNICSRCILIPEQRFVLIHFEKEDERYDKENPAKAVYFILFVDGNRYYGYRYLCLCYDIQCQARPQYVQILYQRPGRGWGFPFVYSDVDSYASYTDYIDEVKQINHISGDDIHAGEYLTIPYYSAQVQ